jgi:hypothetical protein
VQSAHGLATAGRKADDALFVFLVVHSIIDDLLSLKTERPIKERKCIITWGKR